MGKLVIDGNAVYEIDEECEKRKKENGLGSVKNTETEKKHRKGGR